MYKITQPFKFHHTWTQPWISLNILSFFNNCPISITSLCIRTHIYPHIWKRQYMNINGLSYLMFFYYVTFRFFTLKITTSSFAIAWELLYVTGVVILIISCNLCVNRNLFVQMLPLTKHRFIQNKIRNSRKYESIVKMLQTGGDDAQFRVCVRSVALPKTRWPRSTTNSGLASCTKGICCKNVNKYIMKLWV